MNETTKNCLHCGTPMQTQRSTKKYCSESCKQAAFQNRTIQAELNEDDLNNEDEEIATDFNPGIAPANDYEEERVNVNSSPLNVNLNVKNVVQEPVNVKESGNEARLLPVKSSQSSKPAEEENYEDVETRRSWKNHPDRLMSQCEKQGRQIDDDNEDDNELRPTWKNHPDKLMPKYEKQSRRIEPEEEPYQFIQSLLVQDIEIYLEMNDKPLLMFKNPNRHWYGSDLERVKWVSLRFRSILETILILNDMRWVEGKHLVMVRDSYKQLVESWNFRLLPYSYPFKNDIKQMAEKFQKNLKDTTRKDRRVFVKMANEKKVACIAMRFQLAHLVPRVRLSTLEFND